MRALYLFPLLVASLAVADESATGTPERDKNSVVATVNGEPVLFEDIERQLNSLHSGQAQDTRGAFEVDQLMFRLVNDTLLAQEARVLEMQNEEPIPSKLEELTHDLAVKRLEFEEIVKGAEPSVDEIREAFEDGYRTVTLRIITCYEKEEAEAALAELERGAEFEAVAAERSIDDYSQRGGLIENLARVDLPNEIAEVAFDAATGRTIGPIRTGLGWAVIRTDAVSPADPDRFEALQRRLHEVVQFRKAELLRTDLGNRLREAHEVSIDAEAVAAITATRISDGRLMPDLEQPESVVARVGNRSITADKFGKALQRRWRGVRNEEAANAAKPLVLDRMIRDELMLAEALRRGYAELPVVQRARAAFERQLLVPRFLAEVVFAGIEATEDEARAFYQDNPELFRRPQRVHVGQITVEDSEQAKEIAELLRQGTDLSWLARQHSIDGLRESGGDKGWIIPKAQFSALHDALFGAEAGDVLGPMGVPGNYVVVRVNTVEDQGHFTFEEGMGRARAGASNVLYQEAVDSFIQKARSRSEISIHEEVLASMRITGTEVDEEPAPPGH